MASLLAPPIPMASGIANIWKTNYTNTTMIDGRLNIKVDSNTYLINAGQDVTLIDTKWQWQAKHGAAC